MPLGNLTSQFFANIYLNELDYFIKHKLKAEYYIRYVDDFVILHESEGQLKFWMKEIDAFLRGNLGLELHPDKSKVLPLARGIDFVGFKNFYHFRLLRKRNILKMRQRMGRFEKGNGGYWGLISSFQGWQAYSKWADTYRLRKRIAAEINSVKFKTP